MKYQKLIEAWIKHKEWDDEVTHNKETNESVVSFSTGINNQVFPSYFEGDESKDWLSLYMYAPFTVKKEKEVEILKLFNHIHSSTYYGRLVLLDEGRIQYKQIISLDETDPSLEVLDGMYDTEILVYEQYLDDLTEIALTKTTFDQWTKAHSE
jgi:hypothetical protein